MHKFLDRAKHLVSKQLDKLDSLASSSSPTHSQESLGEFPDEADVYRYRKQRGVNLGSWFVLERWITDSPFRNAVDAAQSDHDIARGQNAKEILEAHWDSWITEGDFAWLAEQGVNTVRIPIGFYHVCGADPSVLQGTDFAGLGDVFEGAWQRIVAALGTAHKYGIGVLLDLHAAPGKQNADAHAGMSSSEVAFFRDRHNMEHTIHILTSMLKSLATLGPPPINLVGIELLNEPNPGDQGDALQGWYQDAFRALWAQEPDLPLYIGDSWRTDEYAGFLAKNAGDGTGPLVLDHHLYRCFTAEDIRTPAGEHALRLRDDHASTPQTFARVEKQLQDAGADLVVGEWSAALNPGSLVGADEVGAKRGFVTAQLALFEKHCAGWFFWTYKKEHGGDRGWSFRDAVEAGVFPAYQLTTRRTIGEGCKDAAKRESERDRALAAHTEWWAKYPGQYEHSRFAEGFMRGWDDAALFASLPGGSGEMIGFRGAWLKRRVREHVASRGPSGSIWEYEHGWKQGYDTAFNA